MNSVNAGWFDNLGNNASSDIQNSSFIFQGFFDKKEDVLFDDLNVVEMDCRREFFEDNKIIKSTNGSVPDDITCNTDVILVKYRVEVDLTR